MIRWAAFAAAALMAAQAGAQLPSIPRAAEPGAVQQRQIDEERRRREAERERYTPTDPIKREVQEQPAVQPAPDAVRFLVREIRFTRSEILSSAELETLAAEFRGRQLSLADLRQLAERVNALYKAKGVVTAQAVIPPQDVSDGVVNVRLVEGRVGRINIDGNESTRTEYIASRLRLKPEDLVDLPVLEEALVRFNRTNDVRLQAELKPGQAFGTTDVQVAAIEPPRHELRLTLDNAGSSQTGVWRAGVVYQNRSVLGYRDDLYLSLTEADGQDSRAYSYGFPVNRWGGRLNLAHYTDRTALEHGPLESLKITGESKASIASLRQPAYVGEYLQLDVLAGAKTRYSSNWIDSIFLQRTDTSDRSLGAELQVSDEKSRWLASLTRYSGEVTVTGVSEHRNLGINRGSMRYDRELGGGLSFRGNLSWQTTGDRLLPSSELFFLGGDGSVRGYSVGTFSGDRGFVANLELHHPLARVTGGPSELIATGFFFADGGGVKPFRPPNSVLASEQHLSSVGWGVHATMNQRVYARLTFGRGLTEVPGIPRQYEVHFQLVANAF